MKNDLISRSELIDFLKAVTVTDGITFETGFKQIITDINNQPTAFDVDKVLEELAELAECSSQCASTFYEGLGCGACMWTDVFNIVKRGRIV